MGPKPAIPLPAVSLSPLQPSTSNRRIVAASVANLLELDFIRSVCIDITGEDTPALSIPPSTGSTDT
ncbi:hypothetical protein LX32DRAFT_636644, partial [Colletotrichum zoysiae]